MIREKQRTVISSERVKSMVLTKNSKYKTTRENQTEVKKTNSCDSDVQNVFNSLKLLRGC